ncbi:hypothetical protein F5Y14DRAFT_410255 [Nemania sp. NC0429]|nr:hypothetical protein F5Y14DRAFT_410255 [Nemania sp. NC0429]
MASYATRSEQADAKIASQSAPGFEAQQLHGDDTPTLRNDKLGEDSSSFTEDKRSCCFDYLQTGEQDTSTVLECWEIILVRPTIDLASIKRVFGMNIISNYTVLKDGYAGVRSVPTYSQAELAQIVQNAETEWTARKYGLARLVNRETYSQNLAKRAFDLPACIPSKLGALLDCRFVATNKNPHVRREWKVVWLEQVEAALADEGPRGGTRQNRETGTVRKWRVILRGRETKVSEDGFAPFNQASNPWRQVDERQAAEQWEIHGHEGAFPRIW